MKYALVALAIIFLAFVLADIVLAGACCGDDDKAQQGDSSCFCCCTLIVQHPPSFITEFPAVPVLQAPVLSVLCLISSPIYHPPRFS